jgi:acetyl-CoA carboxylase biotin carboxylase subunit
MLKATAGGGGKGMRAVWKDEDLLKAWDGARQESAAALGMMECILKTNRRASSYRNSGYWDSYGKACHLLKEIVPYKGVKID